MPSTLSRIVRNLSWLTFGEAAIRGAFLLFVMVLARGAGAAAVGVFTVAAGAALVAVPLFAFGQAEVLIRAVAREPGRARRLLDEARRGQRWVMAAGVPLVVAGAFAVGDPGLRWTLLALVPYVVCRVEVFTRGAVFKGLERMEVEVGARILELSIALALLGVVVGGDGPVWAAGVALSAGAVASLGWIRRRSRTLPEDSGDATDSAVGHGLTEGLPFFGLAVCLQLLLRSDTFLAAGFDVPDGEIGHYGAGAGLAWGFLAVPQLLALSLYPTFSRVAIDGRSPARSALTATGIGLAVGVAGGTVLWAFREPVLALLFGDAFRAGAPFLARLAWALPGASASMVVGVVLASWHRQHRGLIWLVVVLAASVGGNVLAIPRLGLLGAATVAAAVHSVGAAGNLVLGMMPERSVREER